jgi:hypothetical protein
VDPSGADARVRVGFVEDGFGIGVDIPRRLGGDEDVDPLTVAGGDDDLVAGADGGDRRGGGVGGDVDVGGVEQRSAVGEVVAGACLGLLLGGQRQREEQGGGEDKFAAHDEACSFGRRLIA